MIILINVYILKLSRIIRYIYRSLKFEVGLSGSQLIFTLFTSATGGSDYGRMGVFASINGCKYKR